MILFKNNNWPLHENNGVEKYAPFPFHHGQQLNPSLYHPRHITTSHHVTFLVTSPCPVETNVALCVTAAGQPL